MPWMKDNSDKILVIALILVLLAAGTMTSDLATRQWLNGRVENLLAAFLTLVTGAAIVRRASGPADPPKDAQ